LSDVPDMVQDQARVKPIYETLPSWQEDVSGIRKWDDLPAALKAYVGRVSELVGVPVSAAAVGPDREQLVFC
jgi:adenylosuccinate synthase